MKHRPISIGVSLILLAIAPWLGSEVLSPAQLLSHDPVISRIFFELRLPRWLATAATGGTLALLGASFQLLFRNPLAEPYILGVSNGVTLGLAIAEIFFGVGLTSTYGLLGGGAASAAVTLLLLVLFSSRMSEHFERIVLVGMGLQFVLSSSLFLLLSYHSQQMGGGTLRFLFGQVPWLALSEAISYSSVLLFLCAILLFFSRKLDALSLGNTIALTLGVSAKRFVPLFLVVTSILITWQVAHFGAIGFVGLIVPHMVRLSLRPENSRQLMSWSFLLGSVLLSYSDVISRMLLPPFEFPIGIITTLIGGPMFVYLLWRR